MDKQRLQQRIVGAVVLIGLGVIFIPMILSGGRDSMPLFGSNIPDKPRALENLKSVDMPARPTIPEKQPTQRIPVDKDTSKKIAAPDLPGKDKSASQSKLAPKARKPVAQKGQAAKTTPAKAWVVQVGSFAKRDNAMKLRDKLRKKNYPAFVELVKNKSGQIYRVRVGPDVSRTQAEERMRKLRDKMKIYGVVMRHP